MHVGFISLSVRKLPEDNGFVRVRREATGRFDARLLESDRALRHDVWVVILSVGWDSGRWLRPRGRRSVKDCP